MLTVLNIPDGSLSESLWGFYPQVFPKESTPKGSGAEWEKCHPDDVCCMGQ